MPEALKLEAKKRLPLILAGGAALGIYLIIKAQKDKQAKDAAAANEVQLYGGIPIGSIASGNNQGQANSEALAALINDSSNSLGGLITTGLVGLAQGLHSDIGDVNNHLASMSGDLTNKIAAIGTAEGQHSGAITTAVEALGTAVTQLFGNLQSTLSTILTGIATDISTVKADDVKITNAGYYTIGAASVAACIAGDGTVDAECTKTHPLGLPNAEYQASQVPGLVRSLWGSCWTGNRPDLACVGKALVGG